MIHTIKFNINLSKGQEIIIQDFIGQQIFEAHKIFDNEEFDKLYKNNFIYILKNNNLYEIVEEFKENIIDYYVLPFIQKQTILNIDEFNSLKNKFYDLYRKKEYIKLHNYQSSYYVEYHTLTSKTIENLKDFVQAKIESFRLFVQDDSVLDYTDYVEGTMSLAYIVSENDVYVEGARYYAFLPESSEIKEIQIKDATDFEVQKKNYGTSLHMMKGYIQATEFDENNSQYYASRLTHRSEVGQGTYIVDAMAGSLYIDKPEDDNDELIFQAYEKIETYQKDNDEYWYINFNYDNNNKLIQGAFIQYMEANLSITTEGEISDELKYNYLNYPINIKFDNEDEENIVFEFDVDSDLSDEDKEIFVEITEKENGEEEEKPVGYQEISTCKEYFDNNGSYLWDGISQEETGGISLIKFFIPEDDDLRYNLEGMFTYADDLDEIESINENIIASDAEPD